MAADGVLTKGSTGQDKLPVVEQGSPVAGLGSPVVERGSPVAERGSPVAAVGSIRAIELTMN